MSAKPENERESLISLMKSHITVDGHGFGYIIKGLGTAADAIIAQRDSGEPVAWLKSWTHVATNKRDDSPAHRVRVDLDDRVEPWMLDCVVMPLGPLSPPASQALAEPVAKAARDMVNALTQDALGRWVVGGDDPDATVVALAALLSGSTPKPARGEITEDRVERAAEALFKRAKGVYREDHDHFPLKNTWEGVTDKIREGWVSMARAALTAALSTAPAKDGES